MAGSPDVRAGTHCDTTGPRQAGGPTMANMRILLVEDHAHVRRALREGLEATGEAQVVEEASTAREAIRAAESGMAEVALMDVELRDPALGATAASGVGAAVAI